MEREMSIGSSSSPESSSSDGKSTPDELAEAFKIHLVLKNDTPEYRAQRQLLDGHADASDSEQDIITAPLFSGSALWLDQQAAVEQHKFVQYGLLGRVVTLNEDEANKEISDDRVFLNTNVPWSAFVCGSQGSGKSHTLSCMLEDCLQKDDRLGPLPKAPSGIVFSYTAETSSASQPCEAAYLCSQGIPVTVLVSPTNFAKMQALYQSIPCDKPAHKPKVKRLQFHHHHLNVQRMMTLMAVSQSDRVPLYMEVVRKILREMATLQAANSGFDYGLFKMKLDTAEFTRDQMVPLKMRLDLLESFLAPEETQVTFTEDWSVPGGLTVIDLSCPFVDQSGACSLFDILLGMFLESGIKNGRVVALDEAHKYLIANECPAATKFTESLLGVIRQQRHLGTRVIISTQEPTLSPRLLDLSTITIVHRFTSPDWYRVLREHLAGAEIVDDEQKGRLFRTILKLKTGEGLVFAPAALFTNVDFGEVEGGGMRFEKVEARFVKMKTRKRLTRDGGKSILSNEV